MMTKHPIRSASLSSCCALACLLSLVYSSYAAPFAYDTASVDLLLGFRKTGGATEMTVNLGAVSQYRNANPGETFPVATYSTNQMSEAFNNLNGLQWAVAGYASTSATSAPISTIWVSRPRNVVDQQSAPWERRNIYSHDNAGVKIDSIGTGAEAKTRQVGWDQTKNTETVALLPAGDTKSYGYAIGTPANFKRAFWGIVEAVTPDDFDSGSGVSRSDLYELRPTDNPPFSGAYLGYFDLHPDGTMTFTATTDAAARIASYVAVDDISAKEGDSGTTDAVFTLTLSDPSDNPIVIGYELQSGSAASGKDFQASSGTVTFAPGATTASLAARLIGDVLKEGDEFFNVLISSAATNGPSPVLVSKPLGIVTIIDESVDSGSDATPPASPVLAIRKTLDNTVISLKSASGVSYQLRTTNSEGLRTSMSQWQEGVTVIGTGATIELIDNSTGDGRFYGVIAK